MRHGMGGKWKGWGVRGDEAWDGWEVEGMRSGRDRKWKG